MRFGWSVELGVLSLGHRWWSSQLIVETADGARSACGGYLADRYGRIDAVTSQEMHTCWLARGDAGD